MKTKIAAIFLLFILILTAGFGCKRVDKATQEALEPISLEYWRVFDGPDAFDEIIANYNAIHPSITINYKKLRYNEYEEELLNALAEDRGPDIFSIHNTWMKKYENKLAPLPAEITLAYPVTKGTVKKEIVPELRTTRSLSVKDLKDRFTDTVYYDTVFDNNQIYGLPLSVDTLALYYNRDLLNNAGITDIPQYWNRDFQKDIKKLTKHDNRYGIIQSGVALGGSDNIQRFSDILSVLMMQNGSAMITETGQIMFHAIPPNSLDNNYNPGLEALRFYTDFSNPSKEVYCWEEGLNDSLEMFISGNLALMFSYSYNLPIIKAQSPKLNFSVAKLPQIEGNPLDVNFANYWIEVVSKKSPHTAEAWDFVQFATSVDQARIYLTKTDKPTALRALINEQAEEDPELGIFAEQILTARSWYKGKNPAAMETIMGEMIDDIVAGRVELKTAINLAASKVQQTIQ